MTRLIWLRTLARKKGEYKIEKELKFILLARGFDLAKDIIKAITYLGLGWFAYLAIGELAGKQTDASFLLGYFGESNHNFPWIVAVIAVCYGLAEQRLRKRKTEYLQGRIRELEQRIDPKRTGSGLLTTGETNPKDKMI